MNKIPRVIMISLALAAITISIVQLFPQSGHLGPKEDFIALIIKTIVPAVIATVVILLFRMARGKINLKLPILGAKSPMEFTATQTQATLWCLVYIVIKLF